MGTDTMGLNQFGVSANDAVTFAGELPKKAFIYKSSRIVQLEIRTTDPTANYELLGVKIIGIPQARGNSPSQWNTN
jgi:hypothetical protein